MNYKFNDEAVLNVFDKLTQVKGVDEYSLTSKAANEIEDLLNISTITDIEDVRAIRNSVVKIFSKFINIALGLDDKGNKIHEGSFEDYKFWNMWMSAITSVCDRRMWILGEAF